MKMEILKIYAQEIWLKFRQLFYVIAITQENQLFSVRFREMFREFSDYTQAAKADQCRGFYSDLL